MIYYIEDVKRVYANPLPTLIYYAQEAHRQMQIADSVLINPEGMHGVADLVFNSADSVDTHLEALIALANLEKHPDVVSISTSGTPMDVFQFVRLVALARIMLPKAMVRVADGRERVSDSVLALCFACGANAICAEATDADLLARLGLSELSWEDFHKKHGCKGDGSCGHCTCGRH